MKRRFSFQPLLAAGLSIVTTLGASGGSIVRLFYDDIPGTTVAALTNAPIFPDQPTFREQLDDFTVIGSNPLLAGLQGKDNSGTSYGSLVRGYLEAPETGDYVFAIASDDTSDLWLGTNHLASGLRRIAFESVGGTPLFAGARLSDRQSSPIPLVRGERYAIQVLHKQGAGASYLQVGWRRPGGVQEIIPTLHLAQYPVDPFLGQGSETQPPVFNATGWNAGDLPPEVTVEEGADLLLQLDVIAAQPTTIEWQLRNEAIAGENLSFLQLRRIPASYNGAAIRAAISNPYGNLSSASTVLTVTPDTTPPAIAKVDTGGNPNHVEVEFNEPVSAASAQASRFEIRRSGGPALVIGDISLLPDDRTVRITGEFNFTVDGTYEVTVRDIEDRAAVANTISPNPTTKAFQFTSGAGIVYGFNEGRPLGVLLFGSAKVLPSGGLDGSGYLEITDAYRNRNGAVLFSERRDIEQVRLQFKARIGDGSEPPAEGFSINLAGDLPFATLPQPEDGHSAATPGTRLSFTFDTFSNSSADTAGIGVVFDGQVVTNVPLDAAGIPRISNPEARWVDVDVDLRRNGRLTLRYDGVTVFDGLQTAFEGLTGAQIGFAARTGENWESHGLDDIQLSFSEGDLGELGISDESDLGDRAVPENSRVRLAVLPLGPSPYRYEWLRDGQPIAGETNRVLRFDASLTSAGAYAVRVVNAFQEITSESSIVTVIPDTVGPEVTGVQGVAGAIREVRIEFNEPLDPSSATNTATYSSSILQVIEATLSEDGRTVILHTSGQRVGFTYPLAIVGLKDRSVAANAISTNLSFISSVNYREEVVSDRPSRYWRFEETVPGVAVSEGRSRDAAVNATYVNAPEVQVPGLLSGDTNSFAVSLSAASSQQLRVPNGADINVGGPWTQKSFEFWFKPSSVPAPATEGLEATQGIFEEGAGSRGLGFYLWRNPANANPGEADLVFHGFDSPADGPGAPFGLPSLPAVYVRHPVRVGDVHHVVGVFDGRIPDPTGELILYVDGAEVGRAGGAGQLYAHTGDVQIGRGNYLIHTGASGNLGYFDGVLDEFALYPSVLSPERVLAHYEAGAGIQSTPTNPPTVLTGVDTRGNPNLVRVTFSQPVAAAGATNPANYSLETADGAGLEIASAILLPDLAQVNLEGAFQFQIGGNYRLTVRDVADQLDAANVLQPNPTTVTFAFVEGGPAGIGPGSELGDRTVEENGTTRFSIVPTGAGPFSYEWKWNDIPLSNETNAVLEVVATAATAGNYTVTLRNEFSEITSAPARLVLQQDVTPPAVVAIRGLAGSLNEVRLRFSEPLESASATNLSFYTIPGLAIGAASRSDDGLEVRLSTAQQVHGTTYSVNVSGVKDRAATPNVGSDEASFVAAVSYREELIAEGAVRYWAFDETADARLETLVSGLDPLVAAVGTLFGSPTLVESLVPNLPGDPAIRLEASRSNRISVANGSDLNINVGPWHGRTFVLSFKAESLPRGGENPEAPLLFEEGANSRGLALYLYGSQDVETPTEALLVFHAWNNIGDGPGSPWGAAQNVADGAVYVTTPIQAGQTYEVAAVWDGGVEEPTGELRLLVNGELKDSASGAGQIYNHSGDIALGRGASYLLHSGYYVTTNGAWFDGTLDEFVILPAALSNERVRQLHEFSQVPPPDVPKGLQATFANGLLVITWDGPAVLQRATDVHGPFEDLPGSKGRHEEPITGTTSAFFRLKE